MSSTQPNKPPSRPPSKPTVVVFAGAFHGPSCMDLFVGRLHDAGFPAQAYSLRTVGDRIATVDSDSEYMRAVIGRHLDRDQDVLLVVHSFAGYGGTAAIANLSRKSRQRRGERGGVVGIAYLAAFLPTEQTSALAMLGGEWAPWHRVEDDEGLVYARDPVATFYHDCELETATQLAKTLKGNSIQGMKSVPAAIGWRDSDYNGRRAYIRCLEDQALPLFVQDAFVVDSGVEWIVKTLPTSHSPFVSRPNELVHIIEELADAFQSAA